MKLKIAEGLSLPDEAITETFAIRKAERLARRRDRDQAWRDKNKERLREYFAQYRRDHPELKAYFAVYHETVTKPNRPPKPPKPPVDMEAVRERKRLKDARYRHRHPDRLAISIALSKAKKP